MHWRKLIFEDGKYRTTGSNEAVVLISLSQKELGNKKAERLGISDQTLGHVRRGGLEPPQVASLPPQSSASTNSATPAG